MRDALYASKIVSYAQGLDLIKRVGEAHEWGLDLGSIARIWRGGCIIRARFLNRITEAYERDAGLTNLMLDGFFRDILNTLPGELAGGGGPCGAKRNSQYPRSRLPWDTMTAIVPTRLPANLLQAQRDFFGAHTYERTDKPAGEWFHTDWPEVIE